MPLPKFKIVIMDNSYTIESFWWSSEGVRIWWDWKALCDGRPGIPIFFCDRKFRVEAALSLLYAHPGHFKIQEYFEDGSTRISKLSAPHEFEVIDERSI